MRRGSVRERTDGRGWEGSAMVNGRRKYVHGATEAEATAKLTAWLADADQGEIVMPVKGTLQEFVHGWFKRIEENVRPRTLAGYKAMALTYIFPALGHLQLQRLSWEDVDTWVRARKGKTRPSKGRGSKGSQVKRISPVTMRNALRVLRLALRDAKRRRLVKDNVASTENVDPPKGSSGEARFLDEKEAGRLVEALSADRLGAMFYLQIAVGLRPSEVAGVTWDRVDLDAGTLEVREALEWSVDEVDGKKVRTPVLSELKTEKSRRTLRLDTGAIEVLREYRLLQNRERVEWRRQWAKAPLPGLVFTTKTGRPVDGSAMASAFRRVAAKAKIEGASPYSLRHSYASLALAAGVPLKVIASDLGHSGVALAGRTYVHVLEELKKQGPEAVGRVLSRKGPA